MKKSKGGHKPSIHYSKTAGCTRNGKEVTLANGSGKMFKSVSKAKHFMRTGE